MSSHIELDGLIDPAAIARLRKFEALVRRWSGVKNLVSKRDLADIWSRHIFDSVQVHLALPAAKTWADIGSGGGFPGIVTAILVADVPGSHVHLVESDGRKCAFLRSVSRETGLTTSVHHGRIEDVLPGLPGVDGVSARALASLDKLVNWSSVLLDKGATGVFLKGKTVARELTGISSDSRYSIDVRPSMNDPHGAIVLVRKNSSYGATSDKS